MHAGRLARGVTTAGSNIGHHAVHLQLAHTLCTLKSRTRRLEYHTSPTQHTAAKRPCGAVFLPKQQPNPFITCHNWCATTQPGCVFARQKPSCETRLALAQNHGCRHPILLTARPPGNPIALGAGCYRMLKPTTVPQTYAHPILTPAFATGRPQCYDHTGTICQWYRHNSRAARHPADIQPSDRGSGTAQSSILLPIQHNHALTHTQLDSSENIAI